MLEPDSSDAPLAPDLLVRWNCGQIYGDRVAAARATPSSLGFLSLIGVTGFRVLQRRHLKGTNDSAIRRADGAAIRRASESR
jgi:hypothetical protein